ncbi:hypothetical protein VMCG_07694 [Cytospora schulzeri]|uniref:Uncharacterized protein n=1 Tax=Cytospora schulzeri TaxID=448051 RepID=A0A423VYY1_9PEZI|nr:hypothetical protein VMCG_07694 [Valsa malicola]
MLASSFRVASRFHRPLMRTVSTLSSNPDIKVFPDPQTSPSPSPTTSPTTPSYLLTYLDTDPPNRNLAVGTTTEIPPTPRSFTENRGFLAVLADVLSRHAHEDPDLQAAARVFASPAGSNLGGGGGTGGMTGKGKRRGGRSDGGGGGGGAGGASDQGGAGGGGAGGWVHLSDVDGNGKIEGGFQPSGTYRILTNEGILGLSPFLTEKLIARLRDEDKKERIS